jgi:ATP-dependent 26S proteasome regulatory subunit
MRRTEYKALEVSQMSHVFSWDATTNLKESKSGEKAPVASLRQLLLWFAQAPSPSDPVPASPKDLVDVSKKAPLRSVLFVYDSLFYMQPNGNGSHSIPTLTREIINMMESLVNQQKFIFLVGGSLSAKVPPELASIVPTTDYPLPNLNYFCNTVVSMRQAFFTEEDIKKSRDSGPQMTEEEIEEVAGSLLGLTNYEAERILTMAVVENCHKRRINPEHPIEFDRDLLNEQKRNAIGEHQAIEITMPKPRSQMKNSGMAEIGAADALKEWLLTIPKLMSEEAKEDDVEMPKGAFIYGMGGLGKDAILKEAAQEMNLPLLHADMAANKGHLQGMSHANFRAMLAFAEANAPCLLALSEFEKMLAGAMSTGAAVCDGGTGSEIYATWLNWMENRTKPVFVVALANSLENVSQPSLRAGRFDRVWFWDMPNIAGRAEILQIHLRKRGYSWDDMDLNYLAAKLDGYTGAEIRAVVKEAIRLKFLRDGTRKSGITLTQGHIEEVIGLVHSTGRTRPAEIIAMRKFATDNGHNLVNEGSGFAAGTSLAKSLTEIAKATPVKFEN